MGVCCAVGVQVVGVAYVSQTALVQCVQKRGDRLGSAQKRLLETLLCLVLLRHSCDSLNLLLGLDHCVGLWCEVVTECEGAKQSDFDSVHGISKTDAGM